MPARNVIKAISRKIKRSELYYLLICNLPVWNASHRGTGSDVLGVVIVIVLLVELLRLMRYLLTS